MKSSFFPTIGITTEFINKIGEGAFGYKISVGTSLKKEDQNKNKMFTWDPDNISYKATLEKIF